MAQKAVSFLSGHWKLYSVIETRFEVSILVQDLLYLQLVLTYTLV